MADRITKLESRVKRHDDALHALQQRTIDDQIVKAAVGQVADVAADVKTNARCIRETVQLVNGLTESMLKDDERLHKLEAAVVELMRENAELRKAAAERDQRINTILERVISGEEDCRDRISKLAATLDITGGRWTITDVDPDDCRA